MPKVTAICYLSSFLFYGMGYSKMLVLKNADVNSYDYTIYISLAMAYFVLTIFLAVIGALVFYVKTIKDQECRVKRVGDRRVKEDDRALAFVKLAVGEVRK